MLDVFALLLVIIAAFAFGYHTGYDRACDQFEFEGGCVSGGSGGAEYEKFATNDWPIPLVLNGKRVRE